MESMRRTYTEEQRVDVLDLLDEGRRPVDVAAYLDIPVGTVKSWGASERASEAGEVPNRPYYRQMPTVAALRTAARMLSLGLSTRRVQEHTGIDRGQLKKLLGDARIAEAMYEFDPRVTYEYGNLLDRATVGHQLCTETFDVADRAAIVVAIIFPKEVPCEARSEEAVVEGSAVGAAAVSAEARNTRSRRSR